MKFSIYAILLLFLLNKTSIAQFNGNDFGISLSLNYTTTSKVYLNPNSSDDFLRNQYSELTDIINPSVELRYRLLPPVILGLNFEIQQKSDPITNLIVSSPTGNKAIFVEDGFKVYPIEFTAYYYFPFSTERFKFLMGGGIGYYFGEYIRKFGNSEISTIEREFAGGIHVIVTTEFLINEYLSIRGDMKFRDPEFEMVNEYKEQIINYEGQNIRLPRKTFESKVNIDGVCFMIGLTYSF